MARVKLCGIADEASPSLEGQLDAHAELGWRTIELRTLGGVNVCEIDDDAFDRAARLVAARGFEVPCLASAIANWARPITADFSRDRDDLLRAAPRARRLGARFIRIMSWPNDGLAAAEWRAEALRRLRELSRIAEGEGVTLVLENCSGWAAQTPAALRAAIEETGSPRLRVVFDTGNAVADGGTREDPWLFYEAARPFVAHVHVKDCVRDSSGRIRYTWPGEGWGMAAEVLADLHAAGWDGTVSIEPHITGQIHRGSAGGEAENAREVYLEYGRKAAALVARASVLRRG
jgi:L-ribulose-5-phosphate 3-epimerase